MLHRVIVTAASVFALTAAANAADMYRPAEGGYKDVPYVGVNWSGLYVGVHGGGAWGSDKIVDKDNLNGGAAYTLNDTGFIGGGQIGYNAQRGNLVFGLEGDLGYLSASKKKYDPNFVGGTYSGVDSGLYGDITGRLGYAFDRTLVYAKGGFAISEGKPYVDNSAGSYKGGRASTDVLTGWTIGAGVEHKLSPAWSVKAEYQYFDFGSQDAVLNTPAHGNFAYSNALTVNAVTAGLNYHVGTSYEPLK